MKRILIIDDDGVYVKNITRIIETIYSYDWAQTFDKARNFLLKKPYDCLLIVTEGRGFDFIDFIKEVRSHSDIPIIGITGQGDEMLAVKFFKAGANDYVPKKEINNLLLRTIQDATRLRRNEAKILDSIVEQMSEGLIVTSSQLEPPGPTIIYCNPALCLTTGYTEEEILGKTPRMFQGPETPKQRTDDMKASLKKGEGWHGEIINYKKDGEKFWIELSISPIFDDHHKICNYVCISRDLTAEKALEARLSAEQESQLDMLRKIQYEIKERLIEMDKNV